MHQSPADQGSQCTYPPSAPPVSRNRPESARVVTISIAIPPRAQCPPPLQSTNRSRRTSTPSRSWSRPPEASRIGRMFRSIGSAAEWLFGLAALLVGLAVLASIPVGQFLALGYVLEAGGRVARSGRIRDGFIGVRTAAWFGGMALAGFLLWLPLYGMSIMAESARIIDPAGPIARQWELGLSILAAIFATPRECRDSSRWTPPRLPPAVQHPLARAARPSRRALYRGPRPVLDHSDGSCGCPITSGSGSAASPALSSGSSFRSC